jgi:hypothetical protein
MKHRAVFIIPRRRDNWPNRPLFLSFPNPSPLLDANPDYGWALPGFIKPIGGNAECYNFNECETQIFIDRPNPYFPGPTR